MQDRDLDEHPVVLLFDRHEHAHDVAEQVRSALGHAVEKNGVFQADLLELPVLLVQVVFSTENFWHLLGSPAWPDCNERTRVAKECRLTPAFFAY